MRNIEYINKQIENMNLNDTRFKSKLLGTKNEINELCNILNDQENLLYIISGFHEGNDWLICLTNSRLIFLTKGLLLARIKQKEIILDKISSINFKKGLLLSSLMLEENGVRSIKIDNINKKDLDVFINLLHKTINNFKINLNPDHSADSDLISKLKELDNLRKNGILNEEEFKLAKQQLLK